MTHAQRHTQDLGASLPKSPSPRALPQPPGPGLNPRVRGLLSSATLRINEHCARLEKEGKSVFRLGLGQSPFPVPRLVGEALQRHAFEKDYLPVEGLPALRSAVARHHRRTFGIDCGEENVLVGPGSKELMFLLQLVYDGEIVIPTPAWVSYAPQARIIGRRVSLVSTRAAQGWQLTPAELDALCRRDPGRPRLLVLNYPSNPTGASYSADELREIASVARRYRVLVLSDEIYGKLHYRGRHASIIPHYPEGTIFSGGLSKWCGAGGWRLGIFVIPTQLRWLSDAVAAVASESYTSTSAPIQHAAVRAFEASDELEEYLRGCRRVLRALGTRTARMLAAAGASVRLPEGGFYLFPDFSSLREPLAKLGIRTSSALCERVLAETGVAILPGADFGRPPEELTARIAFVDFDGAKALAAVAAVPAGREAHDTFLQEHCGRVLEATRKLCEWLQVAAAPALVRTERRRPQEVLEADPGSDVHA